MISILIGVSITQGMYQYFLGVFWCIFIGIIVSANDCFAYLVGRNFGRTPLIRLSPNKTLEGFLGGSVICFIWVYLQISAVFQFEGLMCMNEKLNGNPFEPVNCVPWKNTLMDDQEIMWPIYIKISPIKAAALTIGLMASLLAPFAGFMASGMKRAY